jgi:hypothetical protein
VRARPLLAIISGSQQIDLTSMPYMRIPITGWTIVTLAVLLPELLSSGKARAQDVPGIEICTVEKTMERRTSCLQSNVDFLQKTIARLTADHQQKLDAANRQIESLKMTVAGLQKVADEAKKKADAPAAKDTPPPAENDAK